MRTTTAKTFSYAQALKTSLTESSWSTSPSHTPSETSLMLDTRTPTPVHIAVPSPTLSTPDSPAGRENNSPGKSSSPHPSTAPHPTSTEERVPPDNVIVTSSGAPPEADVAPPVTNVTLEESDSEDTRPLDQAEKEEEGSEEVSVEKKENRAAGTQSGETIGGCGLQQAPPPSQAQSQVQRGTLEQVHNPLPSQPVQGPLTRQAEPLPTREQLSNRQVQHLSNRQVQHLSNRQAETFPVPEPLATRQVEPLPTQEQLSNRQAEVYSNRQAETMPVQEPLATRQVEPLLQARPTMPVSSLEHVALPQKQWFRPVQAHARQPHLVEQPRLQAPRPELQPSTQQSRPLFLQQQAQLQLKQQQLQQLILTAQKQHSLQPQLLQQHVQRLVHHRQYGYPESASIARLSTPPQPLHLVSARPLMTTHAPQGLPVTSCHQLPHPQSLLVLQTARLQHPFHPPLPPQQTHLSFPLAPTTQEVRKNEHPAALSPSSLSLKTSKQQVFHHPASYRGDGPSVVSAQQVLVDERKEENGESKAGLSVSASPFIPGSKTEQSANSLVAPGSKKISPPLVDVRPHHRFTSRPPGFEHPQLPRPVLLQPTVLHQPLSLAAPVRTIQAPPRPTLPLSFPHHPPHAHPHLASLGIQQPQLGKPIHHLQSQTSRVAASVVPARPLSFYHQFHLPQTRGGGGDTLLFHDPTHHQKVTPSLSDSADLLEQAKLLKMSSVFHPHAHAGLIPNPYTGAGVAFVPPVAMPTASLTTPTPTPSPQALAKGVSTGLAAKKPLLPTPTAPQAMMTGPLSSGVPRLSLPRQQQQDVQSLQHSYQ